MVEVLSERDIPATKESGLNIKKGDTFFIKNLLYEDETWVYLANNQHGISGVIVMTDLGSTTLPDWFQVLDRGVKSCKVSSSLSLS